MMAQILGPMPTSLPARLRRLVNDLRRAIANLRAPRGANRDSTRQSIKKKEGTLEKHEDTLVCAAVPCQRCPNLRSGTMRKADTHADFRPTTTRTTR